MIRADKAFSEAVERAVRDAERGTSAELVVVVASRSGSYLDVALCVGAVAAALALLVALFAPVTFRTAAVALEVPLAFALATFLANRAPRIVRVLTPEPRTRLQVERAAAAYFVGESVHGTRARTGLLVYLSLLEERVAIVPDLGLQGHIPVEILRAVPWGTTGDPARPQSADDVLAGIRALGELLRARLPADGTDTNESPDAPRIVS